MEPFGARPIVVQSAVNQEVFLDAYGGVQRLAHTDRATR